MFYNRGFCQRGSDCPMKHNKRIACDNYLLGFCPDGPNCSFAHPKFELPENAFETLAKPLAQENMLCPRCNKPGHRAVDCPNVRSNHIQLLMGHLDDEPGDTAEAAREQLRRLTTGFSAARPMVIDDGHPPPPSAGPWVPGAGTGANRAAVALNPRYANLT